MTIPSSTPPSPASASSTNTTASATTRRVRFGLQSLVLLLSVTASCVFAGLIASRYPLRFDATATREHLLSERTLSTLRSLDGDYEIVVAANRTGVDQRAYQRTRDVLDSFARASKHVAVTFIDTSSSSGIGAYDALLKRLSERYKPEIAANRAALDRAVDACRANQEAVASLVTEFIRVRDSVRGSDLKSEQQRKLLDNYAERARVAAFNLEEAANGAAKSLTQTVGPLSLAPIDDIAPQVSKSIVAVNADLARILREARLFDQATDIPVAVKDQVRPLTTSIQAILDALRTAADSLDRLPKLPIYSVARTLEQSSAALVIGPPRKAGAANAATQRTSGSITAIDFASLFPPALPEGATPTVSIDRRARAEELTATAIASLGATSPPIVVFVHDQPRKLGPAFDDFGAMIDRLNLRGIDVVEWATAIDAEQPSLVALQSASGGTPRPVVYITQSTSPNTQDAADRMKRMGAALASLVGQGKSVLLSANVSTLPGIGTPDPLVDFLSPWGITVDSGRTLLTREQLPSGPIVLSDFLPQRTVGDHPISRAIDGLAMHFFWIVPVRQAKPAAAAPAATTSDVRFSPIVQIEPNANTWAESEWLGYKRIPVAQRRSVIDPPRLDSPRDDGQGPWPVVVAAERADASIAARVQRLVIVGCSGWFLDDVTQQSVGVIDGRPVLSSPGNMELLEASVLWLAGQDELIARSPTAQAAPMIRQLTSAQTQAVRWTLFAGLPALVLLVGAAWRLLRG